MSGRMPCPDTIVAPARSAAPGARFPNGVHRPPRERAMAHNRFHAAEITVSDPSRPLADPFGIGNGDPQRKAATRASVSSIVYCVAASYARPSARPLSSATR